MTNKLEVNGTVTEEFLIVFTCDCGKRLTIQGKGWNISFDTSPTLTCPCGKTHELFIKEPNDNSN